MYLANGGKGWPQGLQRKPMVDFPEASEMAAILGPGETSYTRYDREITAAAVDWLRRLPRKHRPWVLYVSFVSPHFPLSAPDAFFDRYRDVDLPRPYASDADARCHPVMQVMRQFWSYADYFDSDSELLALRNYYGLCSFLDDNVGQVLAALQDCGQGEDTWVVYTSDHGDMIGNHGIWGKSYMYEDSVGIPMVLKGPGLDPGVNATPVSLVDLAATVEHLTGVERSIVTESWRGQSLLDIAINPVPARPVLSEYHDGGSPCGFYMLRQDRWKYVYYSEGHPPRLFDLHSDPRELHNLAEAEAYRVQVGELRQLLQRIMDPEQVNRQAFADQAKMIAALGGVESINAMPSFNHTPLQS